jgi:hypothetical protein
LWGFTIHFVQCMGLLLLLLRLLLPYALNVIR